MKRIFHTPTKDYLLEAGQYTCNRFGLAEFFAQSFRETPICANARALDVGCGVGPISIFLSDQIHCCVLGIELNGQACRDCRRNFASHLSTKPANVIEMDFSLFEHHQPSAQFDLIVSNPPISVSPFRGRDGSSLKESFTNPDAEAFTFLTNWWHDSNGRDLTDHIFDYSTRHLSVDGFVAMAFCEIDGAKPTLIISKAIRFGFVIHRMVSDNLTTESIGATHARFGRVRAHYVVFKKR